MIYSVMFFFIIWDILAITTIDEKCDRMENRTEREKLKSKESKQREVLRMLLRVIPLFIWVPCSIFP